MSQSERFEIIAESGRFDVRLRDKERETQRKRGRENSEERSAYSVTSHLCAVCLSIIDKCVLFYFYFPFFITFPFLSYRSTVVVCVDEGGSCLGVINIKDVVKYYFESANSSR